MNKKDKIIAGLLAAAVVLFCAVQFWVLPARQEKQEAYARAQTDALTHDITEIEEYRSPYIGNASNTGGLFEHLPLSDVSKSYAIDADNCALTVHYLDTVGHIGEQKVRRALIYNSAAAMAAIDNLTAITYQFSGDTYSFDRDQLERSFGAPLSDLLERESWEEKVQNRLNDAAFVAQFFREEN